MQQITLDFGQSKNTSRRDYQLNVQLPDFYPLFKCIHNCIVIDFHFSLPRMLLSLAAELQTSGFSDTSVVSI